MLVTKLTRPLPHGPPRRLPLVPPAACAASRSPPDACWAPRGFVLNQLVRPPLTAAALQGADLHSYLLKA